jgi:hypothetical protein
MLTHVSKRELLAVSQSAGNPLSFQLLPQNQLSTLIHAMDLKHVSGQTKANWRNLHLGRPSRSIGYCYRYPLAL